MPNDAHADDPLPHPPEVQLGWQTGSHRGFRVVAARGVVFGQASAKLSVWQIEVHGAAAAEVVVNVRPEGTSLDRATGRLIQRRVVEHIREVTTLGEVVAALDAIRTSLLVETSGHLLTEADRAASAFLRGIGADPRAATDAALKELNDVLLAVGRLREIDAHDAACLGVERRCESVVALVSAQLQAQELLLAAEQAEEEQRFQDRISYIAVLLGIAALLLAAWPVLDEWLPMGPRVAVGVSMTVTIIGCATAVLAIQLFVLRRTTQKDEHGSPA